MPLEVNVITHRLHAQLATAYRDVHTPDVRLPVPYIIVIIVQYNIVL